MIHADKPTKISYNKESYKPGETNILYDDLQKGEQNLYIVGTPTQLLSAIEAQHHFKTKNNVLVILFFVIRDGKNINQMFKLSELFPYSKLITYQNSNSKNYIAFIKYLNIITKTDYNYTFLAYNSRLYRRMVANINYKKLFYLDDGVHTITTHEQIYNDSNMQMKNPFKTFRDSKLKIKVLELMYRIKGYKMDSQLADLNFYTVFNLQQYKNEEIIKHNFSYLRTLLLKDSIMNDIVYVLGQPLVKAIHIESNSYTNYLKEIFEYYKGRNILYIPHRFEVISTSVNELISQYTNVNIFVPDEPIEFYFINNNIYPTEVASFITTALFNIRKIFPKTQTKAFEIDLSPLSQYLQKAINLIYEHYRNEDIEIIELKCNKPLEFAYNDPHKKHQLI